jgi:hypothetical protein
MRRTARRPGFGHSSLEMVHRTLSFASGEPRLTHRTCSRASAPPLTPCYTKCVLTVALLISDSVAHPAAAATWTSS